MFPRVGISVDVAAEAVTFRFADPVSIMALVVVSPTDGTFWEIVASEMKPVEGGSVLAAMPVDQAPPGLLKLLEAAEARALKHVQEHGPLKPPRNSVVYGDTPQGYREKSAVRKLTPGSYRVMVFGEQCHGSESFDVPAA